jgi:multicomponent Na+:H+ antiporter subunit D
MLAMALALATTGGGYLLVLAIIVPVIGMLLSLVVGGRHAERIALALMPAGLGLSLAIAIEVWVTGQPLVYILGDWKPPLGIALRADGFSAVMLVTAALVIAAAGYFARASFSTPPELAEKRAPLAFWTLLQGLWAALTVVFLGGDLFNLFVALELLTFSAVPLVCLDGRPETLAAALRYLLFALFGSVLYLLGTALLYGSYGTLDIALLAYRISAEPVVAPAVCVAAGLMTAGLLAKAALFPLHLWLPPAHANAPAAASAVLSALVVKASFFLIVRLWFDVMPGLASQAVTTVLATLGAAAIRGAPRRGMAA